MTVILKGAALRRIDISLLEIGRHPQTNRIYDGFEADTRKSQASFQII